MRMILVIHDFAKRRKMHRWLIGLLMAASISLSCKKKDVPLPPIVEFILPAENAVFSIGDTIHILADVYSEIPLKRISLSLLAPGGVVVQHVEELLEQMVNKQVEAHYPLFDSTLESGIYQLMILADQGEDSKKKYRSIQLEGVPRVWEGILAITRIAFDRNEILWIRPDLSSEAIDTLPGDHLSSVILYPSRVLVHAGSIMGGLIGYDLNSRQVIWSVPPSPNPPFPAYSSLSAWQGHAYAGSYDGQIRIFQANGKEQTSIHVTGNRIPGPVMMDAGKLYVDEKSRTSPDRYLGVYHYPSGSIHHVYAPGMETIGLIPISNSEFFWLGNQHGQGVIRIYQPTQSGYYSPLSLPAGNLKACCPGPPGHVFLAMESGIWWYRKDLNSLSSLTSSVSPHWIAFEEISNMIISGRGSALFLHAFPSGTLLGQLNVNDSIFEAHPYYNR